MERLPTILSTAAGVFALAALSSCGGTPPTPEAAPKSTTLPVTQSCADLLAAGWTAPDTDPSIFYDPETGIAKVAFTEPEDTLVLDLLDDADCAKLPDVGPLLARTPENAREAGEP